MCSGGGRECLSGGIFFLSPGLSALLTFLPVWRVDISLGTNILCFFGRIFCLLGCKVLSRSSWLLLSCVARGCCFVSLVIWVALLGSLVLAGLASGSGL